MGARQDFTGYYLANGQYAEFGFGWTGPPGTVMPIVVAQPNWWGGDQPHSQPTDLTVESTTYRADRRTGEGFSISVRNRTQYQVWFGVSVVSLP